MRWIWAIVVVCLIGATGVRPEVEIRDPHDAQLEQAPARLPAVAKRGALGAAPDTRLIVFVVPAPPAVASPPRAVIAHDVRVLPDRDHAVLQAWSARGPPLG